MATDWTKAQLNAINTRDKTLLVSAAAGSGKTATLTERIIQSIIDERTKAQISRMLIVTYTRASAADLKEKISKALSEKMLEEPDNTHVAEQFIALGSAHISTIDSFYYEIVKSNFQKLSLPQAPRIIDDAESIPLYNRIMDETIEEMYSVLPNFEAFMENFTSARNNSMAAGIFISIYDKLLTQEKGIDALLGYAEALEKASKKNIFDTEFGKVALEQTTTFVKFALDFTSRSYEQIKEDINPKSLSSYGEAFADDLEFYTRLNSLLEKKDYATFKTLISTHTPIEIKNTKNYFPEFSAIRAVRNDNFDNLINIQNDYFRFTDSEIETSFLKNAAICLELRELLNSFDEALIKEKTSRGICTFSDVRRFAYNILRNPDGTPTDVALEYRNRFDYIYIDEYQDVDAVQDIIFSTIAKPTNRFMVGDIKQSIYVFRNADPSVFKRYKTSFPEFGSTESDAYSIFMSNNFRCDETIIDFSNTVSSFLFSNRAESVGYTKDDDLFFTKDNKIENYKPTPVTIAITGIKPNLKKGEKLTDEQKAYRKVASEEYIADEILRLVNSDRLSNKKIEFKDIAILSRYGTSLSKLINVLERRGIPVNAPKESAFFENPDVLLVMSLLSAIDNPQKDVSLAGVICSPFFGFTADELYIIRSSKEKVYSLYDALLAYSERENELGAKCRDFITKLKYWRSIAESTPCDKLIRRLYNEMSILSFGTNGNKNLIRLYEYAIKFESSGFKGLYSFIKYVEELIENGIMLPEPEENANDNCVQAMTIHKSKGLEFPVCFIYNCEKSFSNLSEQDKIQFEPHTGIGFTPHDESGFAKYDSPLLNAITNNKKISEKEEEIRLLYVAMTRAKERLYMVSKTSQPAPKIAKAKLISKYSPEYSVLSSKSYFEWIFASLDYGDKKNCYIIDERSLPSADDQTKDNVAEDAAGATTDTKTDKVIEVNAEKTKSNEKDEAEKAAHDALVALFKERFDYKYGFEHISKLPAKLSVSRLSPKVLDSSDNGVSDLDQLEKDFEKLYSKDFAIPESLHSEHKVSAAEKGTATHAFLQFCDFSTVAKNGVENEIARLCEKRFIDPKLSSSINKFQLEAFFRSELFKRISKARRVWREQRFNLFLPAAEFTEIEEKAKLLEDETIAVQGVIDIFFEDENGKIVLCDYKTDYLTKEEFESPALAAKALNKSHARQLSYYAKAITEILGRKPDEVLIYSLPLKNHVSVDTTETN